MGSTSCWTIGDDGPAALQLSHCLSHSPQVLAAVRATPLLPTRDSTLTALRHEPVSPGPSRAIPGPFLGPWVRPWQPDKIAPDPAAFATTLDTELLRAALRDKRRSVEVDEEGAFAAPKVDELAARGGSVALDAWSPPHAIVWDGVAQRDATLTLCGCRFDGRERAGTRAAVRAHRLAAPLVDLGVIASTAVPRAALFDVTAVRQPVPVTLDVPTT